MKYIARAGHKKSIGKEIEEKKKEDLNKAKWYLEDYLARATTQKATLKRVYAWKPICADWKLSTQLTYCIRNIYLGSRIVGPKRKVLIRKAIFALSNEINGIVDSKFERIINMSSNDAV